MGLTRRQLLWVLGAPAPAMAADKPLVVLVDSSVQLPQAQIRDGRVVDGLQYDIALELGRRLGRVPRFRVVPRRRVGPLLASGEDADLICTYLRAWLKEPLQWSRPVFDDGELLLTARRRPAPARLKDVAGQRIGTIAGFEYNQAAAVLGANFRRDDSPNLDSLLSKLDVGRIDHALVGEFSFEYLRRRGQVPAELHPPLIVAHWRTACALAPRSTLALRDLDAALTAMQADGSLARIVERYR